MTLAMSFLPAFMLPDEPSGPSQFPSGVLQFVRSARRRIAARSSPMNSEPPLFPNAAAELLGPSGDTDRGAATAFVDESGSCSFDGLRELANRAANALGEMDLGPGDRLVLCLTDSIDFPACFLGAIAAGVVPVPVNTLWTADDYAYLLGDSAAKAAVVSQSRLPVFSAGARICGWTGRMVVSGGVAGGPREAGMPVLEQLLGRASASFAPGSAEPGKASFWLYSSGSTGRPKAAVHRGESLLATAKLFARQVLGIASQDRIYSAAKLFFAYGLGNSLSFPLYSGATSVLAAGKPSPELVNRILREQKVTVFFGVPTLFAALLASPDLPRPGEHGLRLCVSAGEALPESLGRAWLARTGVDIIDGIGSTEMLHIFLSNVPGQVAYGTSGRPTPGYEAAIVDENRSPVERGEIGDLWVRGPSCCNGYWNQPAKNRETFIDGWMRTGDKYRQTPEGFFVHCGRSDDMLKVGGLWVSPVEVESALLRHPAVAEAAVVGCADGQGLVKPKAFVVLQPGCRGGADEAEELQAFVKRHLAPYKYPRSIEFVTELPRTVTGKLQRFRLRNP
jgi:benzoate-CoA ligase